VVYCLLMQAGMLIENAEPEDRTGACVDAILSSWSAVCQSSFCYHLACHHHCHVYVVSFRVLRVI